MDTILSYITLLIIILLVVDAVIISLFIYVVGKAWEARPDILGTPVTGAAEAGLSKRHEAIRLTWSDIEGSAARGLEGKRLAVINADRLVDRLLKDAGYAGEGAMDRMRALPRERVATAADLMAAHRFRNRLVHEVGFAPDDRDLDTALAQYRAFLTEVGYL